MRPKLHYIDGRVFGSNEVSPDIQRRMDRGVELSRRWRRENAERERKRKEKVRYEVRMTPELRARVSEVAAALFPETGKKDSRLVRAVVRKRFPLDRAG